MESPDGPKRTADQSSKGSGAKSSGSCVALVVSRETGEQQPQVAVGDGQLGVIGSERARLDRQGLALGC